jgi:enterochelin esterase family protein
MNVRLHAIGERPGARVLVVLDGPEYQSQMRLVPLLRRLVARGEVRAHRVALVAPEDRMETYSASARFARELAGEFDRVVGVGASLGGLALLHAHRTHPQAFRGLFLQSGSYFRRTTDPQEARFVRFARVDRFVGTVLRGRDPSPVPTTLTCALEEENYDNNAAVARALAEQDYPVEFHAARGGHDWPTWKRALEAHLPSLLRRAWR